MRKGSVKVKPKREDGPVFLFKAVGSCSFTPLLLSQSIKLPSILSSVSPSGMSTGNGRRIPLVPRRVELNKACRDNVFILVCMFC